MVTSEDFQKAVELIDKAGNILVTTHIRPDGDACGCMIAVREALTKLGKEVKLLLLSPLPAWYEFIFEGDVPVLGEDVSLEQLQKGEFDQFDLVIIVDVNSENQLPGFAEYLKGQRKPVLAIDHHITSDGLGDVELIDSSAAATGLILYDLFKYANWEITTQIATALFVAIATDTGWFQFNNTDGRVYRRCAELFDAGVKPNEVYHNLYHNFSIGRFKLMTCMLNSLELHLDGRIATQQITQQDFQDTGADYSDTENLIDECRRVGSVQAAVLFVEATGGQIRCSLRSTGPIDVRKVAQQFGGGGHKMAAGVRLELTMEEAKEKIVETIKEQFKRLDRKN